jgi:hypothetical protein
MDQSVGSWQRLGLVEASHSPLCEQTLQENQTFLLAKSAWRAADTCKLEQTHLVEFRLAHS